jgi:hypothetical protein
MQTAPLQRRQGFVADQNEPIAAFFETLTAEQSRFLEALQLAGALLPNEGHLAHVAATHVRLTRQLFDAQRSILRRRHQFDEGAATLQREAGDEAADLIASARAEAGLPLPGAPIAPALRTVAWSAGTDGTPGRSMCREASELGRAVVRTAEDARELAGVIDSAFQMREPDGREAQRELGELLDHWWDMTNQEGEALLEDARARAALVRHVASIEATEIRSDVATVSPVPQPAPIAVPAVTQLPDDVLAAFDATDGDLDQILNALAAVLDLHDADDVPASMVEVAPATLHPVDSSDAGPANGAVSSRRKAGRPLDRLRDLETAQRAALAKRPLDGLRELDDASAGARVDWRPASAVVPMAAATSALTVLMAWIG